MEKKYEPSLSRRSTGHLQSRRQPHTFLRRLDVIQRHHELLGVAEVPLGRRLVGERHVRPQVCYMVR